METIEQWALREGVRQIQKQCGKAGAWCDGATLLFDEADCEFWLRWATNVRMAVDAVVGIVDKQMMPRENDHEMMPRKEAERWQMPRREVDGTPKDVAAGNGCLLHDACELADGHPGPCAPASVMYCDLAPECDLGPGHAGKCKELQ